MALVGMPFAGCGDEDQTAAAKPLVCRKGEAARSEYLTTLCDFRRAAAAGKTYDAYGFAEYFPKPQRAAIDAFCFVAERMLEDGEFARLADQAYLAARITRKAEADLESELDIVAPGPAHVAIAKLRAVLALDSLDRDLAEHYVRACY
jgi:hypothetical protein